MAHERILIVEGDVKFSEVLKDRLEDEGYLVECARSGREALDILKTRWVDLIALAIVLRGEMDGFRLFKEIKRKREYSRIPVVIQSSRAAMNKDLKSLGAEAFFTKPYPVDRFIDEIRDILTKKILFLGDNEKVRNSILTSLSGSDLETEAIYGTEKFYAGVTARRYFLIVVRYEFKGDPADKVVSALRGSGKNTKTPVIVYVPFAKISGMGKKGLSDARALKKRCEKLGRCAFMDKGYSERSFSEFFRKYLENA
ncbi:response regulator [Candidatus Omnitrophota bacterium]